MHLRPLLHLSPIIFSQDVTLTPMIVCHFVNCDYRRYLKLSPTLPHHGRISQKSYFVNLARGRGTFLMITILKQSSHGISSCLVLVRNESTERKGWHIVTNRDFFRQFSCQVPPHKLHFSFDLFLRSTPSSSAIRQSVVDRVKVKIVSIFPASFDLVWECPANEACVLSVPARYLSPGKVVKVPLLFSWESFQPAASRGMWFRMTI